MTTYKSETLAGTPHRYYPLAQLGDLSKLPMTVKILLEGMIRAGDSDRDIAALAKYPAPPPDDTSVPFRPARILLQDYTGVPAAVDLAAMRSAMQRAGKDPARIEPLIPVDLIIDHSVQADFFGAKEVYEKNLEREYERNRERYSLLRWAGQAFKTFRVVPPGAGICHQVNLERLSRVVQIRDGVAIPDTLFGADSHTTMVNGLGVSAPTFDEMMEPDLATVRPSVAGPKRPQDRVELPMVWQSFVGPKPTTGITRPGHTEGPKPVNDAPATMVAEATPATAKAAHLSPALGGTPDGSVGIDAITSW